MKPLILAAVSVPALVTGVSGLHHGHGALHLHLHQMVVQRLELTADQQTAIRKIVEAHHPALHADGMALVRARAELVRALANPDTTEGQIREMEAQGSAADLALELEIHRVVQEINPLLSDLQKEKAKQLMTDFHAHVEGFLAGMHEAPASTPDQR